MHHTLVHPYVVRKPVTSTPAIPCWAGLNTIAYLGSPSSHSGGPRAGVIRGGSESTPMGSGTLLSCTPSVISVVKAIRRIWPPHIGHSSANTSTPRRCGRSKPPTDSAPVNAWVARVRAGFGLHACHSQVRCPVWRSDTPRQRPLCAADPSQSVGESGTSGSATERRGRVTQCTHRHRPGSRFAGGPASL